jgi:1-acyl-sn-glycerol-3-phosphate acyltransferase
MTERPELDVPKAEPIAVPSEESVRHPLGGDASFAARWKRRLITLPLFFFAAALITTLSPIGLALSLVVDLLRRSRFALTRGWLAVVVYVLAECGGVVLSFFFWIALRPGTPRWERTHVLLQRGWATLLFRSIERLFALDVRLDACDAPRGPTVCLVRHASLADTLLPVVLVGGRWDLAPRYVLKQELLADPCLDIVGQRIPNAFLTRRADRAGEDARAVELLARDMGPEHTLVIYPEGTFFTTGKLERRRAELAADRRARLAGLSHLLPPRPRGVLAALSARPDASVVVMAHSGFGHVRNPRRLFDGSLIGRRFDVSIRHVPASEVPRDPERFSAWLDEAWLAMDAWVGERA